MNTELPLYTRDEKLVKEEYTDKGRLFIGESLTGKLGAPINLEQANFIGIFGKSGGGKSVQGVNVSSQIVNILASGKKEESQVSPEVYIFSSSKIADFQSFAKQGAYTTVGSEGTLKLIEYLINKAKEREAFFESEGKKSLASYNKDNPDKQLPFILLIGDEVENAIHGKGGGEIEDALKELLNVGRSAGILAVLMGQNATKNEGFRSVSDKITETFVGNSRKNILNTLSPELAKYFATHEGSTKGVMFFAGDNIQADSHTITFGETNYTLIQTPYVDTETLKVPKIKGIENKEVIEGIVYEESVMDTEPQEDELNNFM